ncbi:hypothetical protein F4861DRAFT_8308 [Xylaria intraflava]|nr:hypothetical protein F4861DRAFT_8308 [Xylaria intraflava]
MQPNMHMRSSVRVPPPTTPIAPRSRAVALKRNLFPALAWLAAASIGGYYVSRQLHREAGSFDQIFAQQNTPEVEEARKRGLAVEENGDPRNSLLNVLGWTK